ncbi:MAG: hypothetical protein JOY82_27180 [Streptosporangiaceae bacterium]|nr:hypothetical protein [Streptosporangiaceae bacterium]MBV9858168.1 hypothetical protein [Streptosporangiaceae bacterium]
MADAFGAALAGFRRWAKTAQGKLSGDASADAEELRLLLDYMPDYLGIASPAELRPGHIEHLLLDVYPRKVIVETREETAETIDAMRDFLTYLADSRKLPEDAARLLERELDAVASQFPDAVMDPANWGMGRTIGTLMTRDGVDFRNQADVDRWIAGYNAGLAAAGDLPAAGYDRDFGEDDDAGLDLPGIKEAFGLPGELPPMRLPSEAELAEQARKSPLLGRLAAMASWVGSGRPVTGDGDLPAGELASAVRELAAQMDTSAFPFLWELAYTTDFTDVDNDGTMAVQGSLAEEWAQAGDEDTLGVWASVFEGVVGGTLEFAASLDTTRSAALDLAGHGTGLVVVLFLNKGDGLPVAEVSDTLRSIAVGDLSQEQATAAWEAWVDAHGDPARMLLAQLADLGAVALTGDGDRGDQQTQVLLTSLGLWAVRNLLLESGVEVPLLPPPDEMTAADLLAMAESATEEEFTAEAAAWRAHRTPESSARELLAAAAGAPPGARLLAVAEITELGAAAEPVWREALGRVELRSYAKAALTHFAGVTPDDPWPENLEPEPEDVAWMLTDVLVVDAEDEGPLLDPGVVAAKLRELVPVGAEQAIFDVMVRTPHPDVADVLTLIGHSHPDKKVAKAARKAAYRAASRQAARASGPGPEGGRSSRP